MTIAIKKLFSFFTVLSNNSNPDPVSRIQILKTVSGTEIRKPDPDQDPGKNTGSVSETLNRNMIHKIPGQYRGKGWTGTIRPLPPHPTSSSYSYPLAALKKGQ